MYYVLLHRFYLDFCPPPSPPEKKHCLSITWQLLYDDKVKVISDLLLYLYFDSFKADWTKWGNCFFITFLDNFKAASKSKT